MDEITPPQVQNAESQAQQPKPQTENGTGTTETANAVENNILRGSPQTEAALGILGAGRPYTPGSY